MDDDQRILAAQQQDPVNAARIVRSVAAIEKDFYDLSGPLSAQMMHEAVQIIAKAVTAPWQVIEVGWSAQIVCPEWKITRGFGTVDAWLELSEICADDENDHSWIAAAVRAGPTLLGISLEFRRNFFPEPIIRDDKVMAALLKLGFARDEEDARLFIPIEIEAGRLAMGFEQNDLAAALAPIGKAMKQAIAAKAELDKIVELVRTAAKSK
jgi:hypothetical protein